ncbi:BRO-N domain-containing protein [Bacillus anthracis]|uniref:BRO-N domain-containing protein n=1 Tax=Bacillus anthracis TaxID=1392 RepID=UPI003D24D48D
MVNWLSHESYIIPHRIEKGGSKEEPLFLAKDVGTWIEHTDLSRMVGLVDEEEKLKRTLYVSGQNREMWFLTEDGLYEVLMQSRK